MADVVIPSADPFDDGGVLLFSDEITEDWMSFGSSHRDGYDIRLDDRLKKALSRGKATRKKEEEWEPFKSSDDENEAPDWREQQQKNNHSCASFSSFAEEEEPQEDTVITNGIRDEEKSRRKERRRGKTDSKQTYSTNRCIMCAKRMEGEQDPPSTPPRKMVRDRRRLTDRSPRSLMKIVASTNQRNLQRGLEDERVRPGLGQRSGSQRSLHQRGLEDRRVRPGLGSKRASLRSLPGLGDLDTPQALDSSGSDSLSRSFSALGELTRPSFHRGGSIRSLNPNMSAPGEPTRPSFHQIGSSRSLISSMSGDTEGPPLRQTGTDRQPRGLVEACGRPGLGSRSMSRRSLSGQDDFRAAMGHSRSRSMHSSVNRSNLEQKGNAAPSLRRSGSSRSLKTNLSDDLSLCQSQSSQNSRDRKLDSRGGTQAVNDENMKGTSHSNTKQRGQGDRSVRPGLGSRRGSQRSLSSHIGSTHSSRSAGPSSHRRSSSRHIKPSLFGDGNAHGPPLSERPSGQDIHGGRRNSLGDIRAHDELAKGSSHSVSSNRTSQSASSSRTSHDENGPRRKHSGMLSSRSRKSFDSLQRKPEDRKGASHSRKTSSSAHSKPKTTAHSRRVKKSLSMKQIEGTDVEEPSSKSRTPRTRPHITLKRGAGHSKCRVRRAASGCSPKRSSLQDSELQECQSRVPSNALKKSEDKPKRGKSQPRRSRSRSSNKAAKKETKKDKLKKSSSLGGRRRHSDTRLLPTSRSPIRRSKTTNTDSIPLQCRVDIQDAPDEFDGSVTSITKLGSSSGDLLGGASSITSFGSSASGDLLLSVCGGGSGDVLLHPNDYDSDEEAAIAWWMDLVKEDFD